MRKQLELSLSNCNRGGRRKNAGRKRVHSSGVSHKAREELNLRTPVHVNFKVRLQVRNKEGLRALKRAIFNARKFVSVLHYSLQSNHVHLIIEAKNNSLLTTGMRSLTITFSKCLNQGRIQKERYHLHVLRSVRETRNAIKYVIFNEARHSGRRVMRVDLFSSVHLLPIKEAAKTFKISLIAGKISEKFTLDQPSSWLAKQGLNPT